MFGCYLCFVAWLRRVGDPKLYTATPPSDSTRQVPGRALHLTAMYSLGLSEVGITYPFLQMRKPRLREVESQVQSLALCTGRCRILRRMAIHVKYPRRIRKRVLKIRVPYKGNDQTVWLRKRGEARPEADNGQCVADK